MARASFGFGLVTIVIIILGVWGAAATSGEGSVFIFFFAGLAALMSGSTAVILGWLAVRRGEERRRSVRVGGVLGLIPIGLGLAVYYQYLVDTSTLGPFSVPMSIARWGVIAVGLIVIGIYINRVLIRR
jgi:hypothetical protein